MRSLDLPPEDVIIKCYHCGNQTPMKQVGEYSWGSRDERYSDFDYLSEYKLFACPVCHKVTLIESYGDETMIDYRPNDTMFWQHKDTVLFPINSIEDVSVPPKIKDAFEAALKTQSIDTSLCLIALRRTLELVLKDKGATKWGLKDKIEEIAEKGLLPDTLKEASSLTKILGDSAAHDKDIDIDENDVLSMSEFVRYIIEYIYIVPDRLERYKERFSTKNNQDA